MLLRASPWPKTSRTRELCSTLQHSAMSRPPRHHPAGRLPPSQPPFSLLSHHCRKAAGTTYPAAAASAPTARPPTQVHRRPSRKRADASSTHAEIHSYIHGLHTKLTNRRSGQEQRRDSVMGCISQRSLCMVYRHVGRYSEKEKTRRGEKDLRTGRDCSLIDWQTTTLSGGKTAEFRQEEEREEEKKKAWQKRRIREVRFEWMQGMSKHFPTPPRPMMSRR
ncbi:hypothetical protein BC567DRAFT_68786 [Phyllosticta citribraziliensis]